MGLGVSICAYADEILTSVVGAPGCAACLMLMNSCGSAHILSAAGGLFGGYGAANWMGR